MVFIPPSELPTSFDIPALTELQHRAQAKFNAEQWLAATAAETWSVPGCERITGVFADELVKHAGIDGGAIRVLDLGAGMGQATQSILSQSTDAQVVASDIDESYLEVLRIKREAKGWDKVEVQNLNATVSPSLSQMMSCVEPRLGNRCARRGVHPCPRQLCLLSPQESHHRAEGYVPL